MEEIAKTNPSNIYNYRSDQVEDLLRSKILFLSELTPMGRDSTAHKGKYASLESLMSHTQKLLIKNSLVVDQIDLPYYFDSLTHNGILYLHTILVHTKSNQWIKSINPYPMGMISPQDIKASLNVVSIMEMVKAYGAANTYLRRYAYKAILGIIVDDEYDEDGNNNNQKKQKIEPEYPKKIIQQELITPQQAQVFHKEFNGNEYIYEKIFERFNITRIESMPQNKFNDVYNWAMEQKHK